MLLASAPVGGGGALSGMSVGTEWRERCLGGTGGTFLVPVLGDFVCAELRVFLGGKGGPPLWVGNALGAGNERRNECCERTVAVDTLWPSFGCDSN